MVELAAFYWGMSTQKNLDTRRKLMYNVKNFIDKPMMRR